MSYSLSSIKLDLREIDIHCYCHVLLVFVFLGLSLRNTSKTLELFRDENKRRYVSVWN